MRPLTKVLLALAIFLPFWSQAAGTNLVPNPSVETRNPANLSLPQSWNKNHVTGNTSAFSYPVSGFNLPRAIKVQVTNYTGDSESWYFNPVTVTPGNTYSFSDTFFANAKSYMVARFKLTNGSSVDLTPVEVPASSSWKTASASFVAPAGATTLTVLHGLKSIGSLTSDNFSLTETPVLPPPPPPAPVINSFTATPSSITAGQSVTLAWSVSNASTTSLNQGIGAVASTSIQVSPTATTTYTLTVSNTASSTTKTVTVNVSSGSTLPPPPPPPPPPASNLILNPSLETDATLAGTPDHWHTGSWGTNNAQFTYPVAGQDGVRAAQVTMTNYTDGDAKWYFDDVAVTAGQQYQFSDYYQSTAASVITIRYTNTDGSFTYAETSTLPASAAWQKFFLAITPPTGAVSLTVFHLLRSVGSLSVDNFVLTPPGQVSTGPNFDQGYVSLTFDDGWYSQYQNARPILNQAGIKAGFYIITNELANANQVNNINLIANSAWFQGNWGGNTAQFTSPVTGHTDGNGREVTLSNYTDGDAKWYFDDVVVAEGQQFNFSDYYQSTAESAVVIRYTNTDGTNSYVEAGTLPATATWQQFSLNIAPPKGVVSLTIFHLLRAAGTLDVSDYVLHAVYPYDDASEILNLQADGHEVSAHSRSHPDLTTVTPAELTDEVTGSRSVLISLGLTPADTFVYPYGTYNANVIQAVKDAGFIGSRSVDPGYNLKTTNKYALFDQNVGVATTAADIQGWINTAVQNKTWLVLTFHQIDHSGSEYSTTPEILQTVVNYLKAQNVATITLHQGLNLMNP